MSRADNTFRQVSTLRTLELEELNRVLRKIQGDIASLRGQQGPIELRDALQLLAPPRDPGSSKTDSSTLFYDISRACLRASENGEAFRDVLSNMGVWKSEQNALSGNQLPWDSQLTGRNTIYGWDSAATITLKQSGLYLIAYRVFGVHSGGALRVNLSVGDDISRALYTGLGGSTLVVDFHPYVKVDDGTFTDVTLDISAGTSIGSSGSLSSYLIALKVS